MSGFWSWFKKKERKPQPARETLHLARRFKEASDAGFDALKPAGRVTEDCVTARREGPPCDLSQIVIREKGTSREATYARAGLAQKKQLRGGGIFEVVAGPKAGKKKTTLDVEVITDLKYCGRDGHPLLVVKPMHETAKTLRDASSKKSVQVWRSAGLLDEAGPASVILRMWQASIQPNVFAVTARACGCRPAGGRPTRELTGQVHVYPDDEYSMSLTLPPFKTVSKSGGGERELVKKYKVGDASEPKPRPGLKLLRNGLEEAGAADLSQVINTILEIKQLIEMIKGTILSIKVKVGWYFDLDYTLLEGTLTGTWGWREHTDHRAFFGYAVKVDLTILELTAGIGFGLDVSVDFGLGTAGLIAKVDGTITARFSLSASVEHSSPDSASLDAGEARIEGSCHASISAHVMALHPTVFELYGEVKTGLELEGGLEVDEHKGFCVDAAATWTGITAYGRATGVFGGKHKRVELLEPRTLGSWQYPPLQDRALTAREGA